MCHCCGGCVLCHLKKIWEAHFDVPICATLHPLATDVTLWRSYSFWQYVDIWQVALMFCNYLQSYLIISIPSYTTTMGAMLSNAVTASSIIVIRDVRKPESRFRFSFWKPEPNRGQIVKPEVGVFVAFLENGNLTTTFLICLFNNGSYFHDVEKRNWIIM